MKNLQPKSISDFDQKLGKLTSREQWILKNRIPGYIQSLHNRENINISDEHAFKIVCEADPSLNNSGVQWICETYCRKGFLYEDIQAGKSSKVWDTLQLFNRYRKHLNQDDRNLYKYKTLAQVYQSIEPYALAEQERFESNLDLVEKQAKRAKKEKAFEETCVLLDKQDLKAVIPLTQQAAQWWGKGTRWCTASDHNSMFDYYNKQAPLIVCLFKDNNQKHRRLQVWVTQDNFQFMDETDEEIKVEFIKENWTILQPIVNYILNTNGRALLYVPEQFRTKELCRVACEQTGEALQYVRVEFRTQELCKSSVEKNGYALQYVPKNLKTKELCWSACEQNGEALEHVPQKFKTTNLCLAACKTNGYAICSTPVELRTEKLYAVAVQQSGQILGAIHDLLKTKDLCLAACEQDGYALKYVPLKFKTKEICWTACERSGQALQWVPKDLIDQELCAKACAENGRALASVPEKLRTNEICKIAIQKNGEALACVPKNLRTKELCWIACEQNAENLEYVPQELKTEELCFMVCKKDKSALLWVPENIRTVEFVRRLDLEKELQKDTIWQLKTVQKKFEQANNPNSEIKNLVVSR